MAIGNSFSIPGGRRAVLLIQGFTASTQELEGLARSLADRGFGVSVPNGLQRLAASARKDPVSLTNPLLVIHSRGDRTASFDYSRRSFDRARATEKRFVELTESGHIISDDVERAEVARKVIDFLER